MRPALAVALLVLLAGCSSPSDSDPATGPDGAGADDASRQSVEGDDAPVAPTAFEEVDWDGDLGTHLCASPAGATEVCPTTPFGPPTEPMARDRLLFVSETTGPAALSGNLTLTWEAQDFEVSHTLIAMLGVYACSDACDFVRSAGTVSGTSPLGIGLGAVRLDDGESFGFYLRPPHSQVANTPVTVGAGQAVHLAGTIGSAPV